MKIRKGDRVKVISGKDKGAESEVMRAIPSKHKVVVEKVAIAKKHQKPTQQNQQGGIMEVEMPIDVSNVMLICPKCGEPTRVGIKHDGKKKLRVCKKCGGEF
ncbi:MAG: 50S ribosomal protein L24 [Coriobacteriales bacterium]